MFDFNSLYCCLRSSVAVQLKVCQNDTRLGQCIDPWGTKVHPRSPLLPPRSFPVEDVKCFFADTQHLSNDWWFAPGLCHGNKDPFLQLTAMVLNLRHAACQISRSSIPPSIHLINLRRDYAYYIT